MQDCKCRIFYRIPTTSTHIRNRPTYFNINIILFFLIILKFSNSQALKYLFSSPKFTSFFSISCTLLPFLLFHSLLQRHPCRLEDSLKDPPRCRVTLKSLEVSQISPLFIPYKFQLILVGFVEIWMKEFRILLKIWIAKLGIA